MAEANKFEGLDRLKRKLAAMPEAVKTRARAALEKNATEITDMQKRLAPFKSGALRNSINWVYGSPPKSALSSGDTESAGFISGIRVSVFAGDDAAFYARWVEFGTQQGVPAQPFFYPAYRALKKRAKARLARAVRDGVKAAAGKT